jgi:queuine/archaeosine tRNA-ribosyltransferase
MESYVEYATGPIGFGSFGTSGGTNGVNTVTNQSVEMLRSLTELARDRELGIHLFGVSTPPILYLFHQLGISSFDRMAWMKAAGFGNIFLPFVRGYMATYRVIERTHTYQEHFDHLKTLSGHGCVFCDDFALLKSNRMYRIMHNLTCVLDTLDLMQQGRLTHTEIMQIIALGSPTYLRYYEGDNR